MTSDNHLYFKWEGDNTGAKTTLHAQDRTEYHQNDLKSGLVRKYGVITLARLWLFENKSNIFDSSCVEKFVIQEGKGNVIQFLWTQ